MNDNKQDHTNTVMNDNKQDRTNTVMNDNKQDRTNTVMNDNKQDRTNTIMNDNKQDHTNTVLLLWVTPIFRSLQNYSSTTGGWSRWYILMCLYISFWALRSLILDFTDAILFLQGLPFFVYISIFFSFCMCVMYLTSIWRILLMTDGLNAVGSNDRAAPRH